MLENRRLELWELLFFDTFWLRIESKLKYFSWLLQVGVAIGCATRDRTVAFASTFAAFLARAYDQIRMGAISQSNVNLVGSHCGVSIGAVYNTLSFLQIISCPFLTLLLYRRRWALSDGLGGLGHVPCHPNMHCVLPQWCGVNRKGCWAVCKHKSLYSCPISSFCMTLKEM